MKYNQTAVDAIEKFEKTVESLRLDPTTAVQLGSILNSVEVQVEENRQVPEVVAHLYTAMQALIRACNATARNAALPSFSGIGHRERRP